MKILLSCCPVLIACLEAPAQTEDHDLLNARIDSDYTRRYNSLADLLRAEDHSCRHFIDTLDGFVFWGFQAAFRSTLGEWTVLEHPGELNINTACEVEFLTAERIDLNQDNYPEFIFRFRMNIHGYSNLQGVIEDYVQIWDPRAKTLILNHLERSAEFDFAAEELGAEVYSSPVTYRPGAIVIGRGIYAGLTSDEADRSTSELKSDVMDDRTYIWLDGEFVPEQ